MPCAIRRPAPPGTCWDGADGGVELALRDEGPGVPPDDLPRIFDKGYRGSNAEGVRGQRPGLYMARSVVEVHGGTLDMRHVRPKAAPSSGYGCRHRMHGKGLASARPAVIIGTATG
jgi:signal transduction histidine kinase